MAFDPSNYLDLWNIVVYEVVGGLQLFTFLSIIVIGFLSAKLQIPFQVGLILIILFLAIIVAISGNIGLWAVVVLLTGSLAYYLMARALRRG